MKSSVRCGFTLLEVIIFVSILSVVLISATSFVTRLLINIRSNEYRNNAIFLADDVREWLNGEREANTWAVFFSEAGNRYCLNQQLNLNTAITALGTATYPASACANAASIQAGMPPIYRRELTLTANGTNQVTGIIRVFWVDNGTTKQVEVQTIHSSAF